MGQRSGIIPAALAVDDGHYQPIPNGAAVAPLPACVEAIRDGDIVKKLRVRCTCGNVLEIACDYGD
jgi:hypothetical protein